MAFVEVRVYLFQISLPFCRSTRKPFLVCLALNLRNPSRFYGDKHVIEADVQLSRLHARNERLAYSTQLPILRPLIPLTPALLDLRYIP